MDNFLFRLSNFFLYIIYSFNYTNKKREAGDNTAGVIDTTSRTPARPPIFFGFVPLPTTKPARYAHTLPVIRIDKAHFVRQFNRTKYPCKRLLFIIAYNIAVFKQPVISLP